MSNENNTSEDYAALRSVLDLAYEQASCGKGKKRHANGKPFTQQPIMEIGRMVGIGFQLGQAMKKAQEAGGMASRSEISAAQAELLGAINFLAAAHIQLGELPLTYDEMADRFMRRGPDNLLDPALAKSLNETIVKRMNKRLGKRT